MSSEHLDRDTLDELKMIMEDDFDLLINTFIRDSGNHVQDMKSFLAAGDAANLRRSVHSIKGSSMNIGAAALAVLCADLEKMAVENNLRNAPGLAERVEEERNTVAAILESDYLS